MTYRKTAALAGMLALLIAAALAGTPSWARDASKLGKTLTPFGAIRAGNASGTIPPWKGGVTEPVAGYKYGDHHPDPFAGDRVQFTITAENAARYADKLSAGHLALLRQYPTFRMNVYPTRRSASAPQRIYEATIANATRASLTPSGNGVVGAREGIPFPQPENGLEAVWNHVLRWRGVGLETTVGQANPTTDGKYTLVKFKTKVYFPYHAPGGQDGNIVIDFLQETTAPARLAGEVLLVHETIDQVAQPRQAWTYNPGQRRVRRAPNVAYDNPGTASDGLRTADQFDMFNGAPDRYEWTLVGRKEMYVPYNSYKLHSGDLSYDDIIQAKHINQDYARYELHRVWVVDAKLKEDTSHIYSRRTFYIDEDSWQILTADHYDARGQLWRVAEAHCINYYEVPTFWSTLDVSYDLQSGRYSAFGLDNQEDLYDFRAKVDTSDFRPESLRRTGRR